MSQWFPRQERKGGKSTPDNSSGVSRGRSGRPIRPDSSPAANKSREIANQSPAPDWEPRGGQSPRPTGRNGSQVPPPTGGRQPQWNQQQAGYGSEPVQPQTYAENYQDAPAGNYQNQYQENYQTGFQDAGGYEEGYADEPELLGRIEFRKRLVALIFDFLACYIGAFAIMLIPFLNAYLSVNLVFCLLLLIRDFTFEGRGIGKNLMGLQVVDSDRGTPPSLKQSALRNIVLVGPYLLTQIASLVLHFIPFNGFNAVVTTIINVAGLIYVIIVIPMEVYRSYNRPDGHRLGDQLAHTEVIESSMDFSSPLPRR